MTRPLFLTDDARFIPAPRLDQAPARPASAGDGADERRRAQDALEWLAEVVQGTEDAVETLALDWTVTSWNPGAERTYGYLADEIVGSTLERLMPAGGYDEMLNLLAQVAAGRSVGGHRTRRIRRDGTLIDVALSISPIRDRAGGVAGVSVIARDITAALRDCNARNVRDEQRAAVLTHLIDTQHEERLRLARELHDGLGQTLTSAALFAAALEKDAPAPFAASVGILRGLVEDALASTRTVMWRLRPVEVDELGFVAALRAMAAGFAQRHGIPVDVHVAGVDDLGARVGAAVYRVAREAITNACAHAAPATVSVLVTRTDGILTLVVEDDGAGFDPSAVTAWHPGRRGAGIVGMRECAAALDGTLAVESRFGGGTTVRLIAPAGTGAQA